MATSRTSRPGHEHGVTDVVQVELVEAHQLDAAEQVVDGPVDRALLRGPSAVGAMPTMGAVAEGGGMELPEELVRG